MMEDAQKKKKVKVFVKNNLATVICYNCGHAKQFDVTKFRNLNKTLRCRCKCGESFFCTLEFRQYFRKKTQLSGHFIFLKNHLQHKIIVNDVSQNGINFSMKTVCDIKIGDRLKVFFTLDDANKTVIRKQVEVKSANDQLIGCGFTDTQSYEKELGFYLR